MEYTPQTDTEKIFLEKFGENEFLAVMEYMEDCETRKDKLVENFNKESNLESLYKKVLDLLKSNEMGDLKINEIPLDINCKAFSKDGKERFNKEYFLNGGIYINTLLPSNIMGLIRKVSIDFHESGIYTIEDSIYSGSLMATASKPELDYHKKEKLFYIYGKLVLNIIFNEKFSSIGINEYGLSSINIPIIDVFLKENSNDVEVVPTGSNSYKIPLPPSLKNTEDL